MSIAKKFLIYVLTFALSLVYFSIPKQISAANSPTFDPNLGCSDSFGDPATVAIGFKVNLNPPVFNPKGSNQYEVSLSWKYTIPTVDKLATGVSDLTYSTYQVLKTNIQGHESLVVPAGQNSSIFTATINPNVQVKMWLQATACWVPQIEFPLRYMFQSNTANWTSPATQPTAPVEGTTSGDSKPAPEQVVENEKSNSTSDCAAQCGGTGTAIVGFLKGDPFGQTLCKAQCWLINAMSGIIAWAITYIMFPALGINSSTPGTSTPPDQGGGAGNPTPPNPALNLKITANSNSITLNWTAINDAAKYTLYKNGSKLVETTNLNYIDSDVKTGQKYQYILNANDSSGKNISVESKTVTKTATGVK